MSAILFLGIGVLIVFSNTDQPSHVPANPPSDDDPSKNPKESLLDKMKRLLKKGQERCEKMESEALEDSERDAKILAEGPQKQEKFRADLSDLKEAIFDAKIRGNHRGIGAQYFEDLEASIRTSEKWLSEYESLLHQFRSRKG